MDLPELLSPRCLLINNLVVHISSERSPSVSEFLNNNISNNNYRRSFPVNTSRHEIEKKKKKFQRKLPHSSSEHYYYCVYLLSTTGRQWVTVNHCAIMCELEVRHWFTHFLPTTTTRKNKIQIESLAHILIFPTCFWTDGQLLNQTIGTEVIEAMNGMSWGLAWVECFLIAGNYGRIHVNLGHLAGGRTSDLKSWRQLTYSCSCINCTSPAKPICSWRLYQQHLSPPPNPQYKCVKCMAQTDKDKTRQIPPVLPS